MKKLTDAQVATALGWSKKSSWSTGEWLWESPAAPSHKIRQHVGKAPSFTTSLDTIVAEIMATDIYYEHGHPHTNEFWAWVGKDRNIASVYHAQTAPLALCRGLLAYLKEAKRGKA